VAIEKNTVAFQLSIFVIDGGIFHKIAHVAAGVVEPALAINFIGFAGDGRWSVQIGMSGLVVKIQLFGFNLIFRIGDVDFRYERIFFVFHIISANIADNGRRGIAQSPPASIIGLLFFPVEKQRVGGQRVFLGLQTHV